MKTRFTKQEINIYCIGYLLELQRVKDKNKEDTKIINSIINQLNDRLERQARRKK